MKVKELNVELPAADVRDIKVDAVSLGVPLKEYAGVVFKKFLSRPIAERRAAFVAIKRKTVGRKVAA